MLNTFFDMWVLVDKYRDRAELYKAAILKLRNECRDEIYSLVEKAYQARAERDQQARQYDDLRALFVAREESRRQGLRPDPLPVCDPATCMTKTASEPCSHMAGGICLLSGRVAP